MAWRSLRSEIDSALANESVVDDEEEHSAVFVAKFNILSPVLRSTGT